jgi:hypothetical protein
MTAFFYAHSGIRFLVLLLGVLALAYSGYGWAANRPADRASRILGAAFVGTLDVQAVIGIILVVTGLYYPALIGHIAMMLMAVLLAHVGMVVARRTVESRRAHLVRFLTVLFALVLVAGGIAAIGRPLLGTGRPSMIPL